LEEKLKSTTQPRHRKVTGAEVAENGATKTDIKMFRCDPNDLRSPPIFRID
jgi:hypothetical protein